MSLWHYCCSQDSISNMATASSLAIVESNCKNSWKPSFSCTDKWTGFVLYPVVGGNTYQQGNGFWRNTSALHRMNDSPSSLVLPWLFLVVIFAASISQWVSKVNPVFPPLPRDGDQGNQWLFLLWFQVFQGEKIKQICTAKWKPGL